MGYTGLLSSRKGRSASVTSQLRADCLRLGQVRVAEPRAWAAILGCADALEVSWSSYSEVMAFARLER
jgi:hypothetical protein